MTGLELIETKCRALNFEIGFCTELLRKILKYGGKDLRSTPLVNKVLKSMEGTTQDMLLKALETTEWKFDSLNENEILHPNYFIAVITNAKSRLKDQKADNLNLNWGNSI